MSDEKIIMIPKECGAHCYFYFSQLSIGYQTRICELFGEILIEKDMPGTGMVKCSECSAKIKVEIVYGE